MIYPVEERRTDKVRLPCGCHLGDYRTLKSPLAALMVMNPQDRRRAEVRPEGMDVAGSYKIDVSFAS